MLKHLSIYALLLLSSLTFSQIRFEDRVNFYDETYQQEGNRVTMLEDLDNDGDMDLIVYSEEYHLNKIYYYENVDGDFTYYPRKLIGTASYVYDIAIGDVDNDGFKDVVTAHAFDKKIIWFKNQNGSFSEEKEILSYGDEYSRFISYHLADIDGDGLNDLLVSTNDNTGLHLMKNLGDSNFSNPVHLSNFTHHVDGIKTNDIDNDGDIDVFVGASTDAFFLMENLGNGELAEPRQLSAGVANGNGFEFLDYNKDGLTDIITANGDDKIVLLLSYIDEETKKFSFEYINLITNLEEPVEVQLRDIDNDDDLDIFVLEWNTQNKFGWYENLGDGNFSDINVISHKINNPRHLFVEDFNNDDKYEILISSVYTSFNDYPVRVSQFNFNKNPELIKENFIDYNFHSLSSFFIHDFNEDLTPDIGLFNFKSMVWFENRGDLELSSYRTIEETLDIDTQTHVFEDINNDGYKDLIFTVDNYATLKILLNDGNNNFTQINEFSYSYPDRFTSPVLLDMDNDGLKDLIFLNNLHSISNSRMYWIKNIDGTQFGNLQSATEMDMDYGQYFFIKFSAADINNDGLVDLVGASSDGWIIDWFQNMGDTNFTRRTITQDPASVDSFVLKDIDNDNDIDIISYEYLKTNNQSYLMKLHTNDGNGNFQISTIGDVTAPSLVLEDINNDGLPDIIGCSKAYDSSERDKLFVYINLGSSFGGQRVIDNNLDFFYNTCSIQAIDLNGDRKNEILLSGDISIVGYYLNNSTLEVEDISNTLENPFTLYPNPFTEFINWSENNNIGMNKTYSVKITDLTGKTIYNGKTNNQYLNLNFLSKGIYIFNIESNNNSSSYKIIKK